MRLPICLLLLCAVAAAQNVLVITPDEFQPALKEWRAHREAQGCKITVKAPQEDLKALVSAEHTHVLLLGDVKRVRCHYRPAKVIRVWERDDKIASDNQLADRDGDGLPDLAVGRVPADDVEEAKAMLSRVIAYERNADYSTWRRRVNVIAGVGGFGKLQDALIERAATLFLSNSVPLGYDLHVTYANPNSPFCPPPTEVGATSVERFNEGALIWTYLGHGSRQNLDWMRFGKKRYPIFSENHAYEMKARKGPPIVFIVACSAGHMDGAPDCLSEIMLRQEGGPVAVIASSRVSMPYGNGVLCKEVLDAMFKLRLPTLGEVLAHAKRRTMKPDPDDEARKAIEGMALFYQRNPAKRAEERSEHLYLYNLLGDPTMRIPYCARAELKAVQKGRKLELTGTSPFPGTAHLELVEARTPNMPAREGDEPAQFRKAYERANARIRLRAETPVENGRFLGTLQLPDDFKLEKATPYFARVYVTGPGGAAAGGVAIVLGPAGSTEPGEPAK